MSSDHLLLSGGELPDAESIPRDRSDLTAEPSDRTRIGMRLGPQNELQLSFRLLTEPEMLSRRGRYDGSGWLCDGTNVILLVGVQKRGYGDSLAALVVQGGDVSFTIGNSLYEFLLTGCDRGA